MKALLCSLVLFSPAVLLADSLFTLVSPTNGSTVVVTPNQVLPVIMLIEDQNTGIGDLYPMEYTVSANVTPTCPPEASPCANFVFADGAVPPFITHAGYRGAVVVINFQNAPAGFYSIALAISVVGCISIAPNCNGPDTFSSNTKFTAQVVSGIGAPANALPEFAVGGGRFLTDFLVINNGSQAANFTINFYGDDGSPASLPFPGLGTISTLSDTVPPFGVNAYEGGDINGPTQGGWGLIQADPAITIQEVIRNRGGDHSYYEGAVPAYAGSSGFRLSFDATTFAPSGDQIYTGFAVANVDGMNPATVTCTARDFRGQVIPNAITIPTLNPLGHWANYLFPALQGARGTLDCSSATNVAAVGLRFIGTDAFTSLPIVTK